MEAVDAATLRASFVNCSRSVAATLPLPELADQPWADLDFLGWRDARAPLRAYLVAPRPAGLDAPRANVGLVLRVAQPPPGRRGGRLCALCHAAHAADGVRLVTGVRPSRPGGGHSSAGTYLCADLACSLYARGLRLPPGPQPEPAATPGRLAELVARRDAFVTWLAGSASR